MKGKRFSIFCAALAAAVCASLGLLTAAADAPAEQPAAEPALTLGSTVRYASLPSFDMSWAEGALETDLLTISPDDLHLLGPGSQDVTAQGTGYVVYRLAAATGRTFRTLTLNLTGRVFHYNHDGNCGCALEVLARTNSDEFMSVFAKQADDNGEQSLMSVDLTAAAAGRSSLDVKIVMTGDQWSWVGLSELSVAGSYEVGADETAILFDREPGAPEPARVGERCALVPYQLANAEGCALQVAVTRRGAAVAADETGFVPTEEGAYEVLLTLTREGSVCASASYAVWASAAGNRDGMAPEHYLDPDCYYGSAERAGDALQLTGSAAYMRALPFERHVKFRFDTTAAGAGSTFAVALGPEAGVADFAGRRKAGLYFFFSDNNGRLEFSAVFSDGHAVTALGNQPEGFSRPFNGAHAVEIRKYYGDPNYADGTEMLVDGVRFSDWLGYSAVKLSKMTSADDSLYLSVRADQTVLSVVKLVNVDSSFPLLNLTGFPGMGTVGEPVELPEAEAVDEVDGRMELTVTLKDPYGAERVLTDNRFVPEYEGTYEVTYSATDFSGNLLLRRRDILVTAKEGMPAFRFALEPNENGRRGRVYAVPMPEVLHADAAALTVTVTGPDGLAVELDENFEFVPDAIGAYRIVYTAANDIGTTHSRYTVHVKRDVDETESYERVTDADEWVGDDLRQAESGVKFWGNVYYPRPFEMSNGIEVTLDLAPLTDKAQTDCWLSLALLGFPGYANYANHSAAGLYFMFYRQNGTVYYNALTRNSAGKTITVAGGTSVGAEVSTVIVRVEKYTGDPNYYDNIVIYVNDVKNENFSIFDVALSDLVDNENFTYLAMGAYGGAADPEALRAGVVAKVTFADHTPPTVTLGGTLVQQVKLGDTLTIPTVTVADNVDEIFFSTVRLYDPEGRRVKLTAGSAIAERPGLYTLVVKAQDNSGNSTIWVRQIAVTGEEEPAGGGASCQGCSCGAGTGGAAALGLLAAAAIFLIRRMR